MIYRNTETEAKSFFNKNYTFTGFKILRSQYRSGAVRSFQMYKVTVFYLNVIPISLEDIYIGNRIYCLQLIKSIWQK